MDLFKIQKERTTANISSIALLAVFLSSFIACIDLTVISTAIPKIKSFFLTQEDVLQWVIVGLMITLSSTMILAGKLADMYGAKKLLLYGLAILFLGSLIAALSLHHRISILITGRIIQGVGIAILYTSPPAIINENFPRNQVGKIMGYYFGVNGLGLALGPIIGSMLVYYFNWRSIFLINLPITAICFALIFIFLHSDQIRKSANNLDVVGAFLLISGLAAMLTLITNIHQWGIFSYPSFITFVFCIVVLCVFYRSEQETEEPIIRFSIFKNKKFLLSCLCNAGLAAMYSTTLFFIPQALKQEQSIQYPYLGAIMLLITISLAITSTLINRLVVKKSVYFVLFCGFVLLTTSVFIFSYISATTTLLLILLALCLFGIGWGFILSPSITLGMTSTPMEDSGNSMGIIGTCHNLGGAVGLAISVLLFDYVTKQYSPLFSVPFLFLFFIGLSVMVCIILFWKKLLR